MPTRTSTTPTPLHRIAECPDLMADACLCDEQRNLIFVSLWGRDTAMQEFLARLTLGQKEQGLDQFHLVTEQDLELPVFVANVDMLEKRTTRAFRRTLFGSMVHLWIFDRRCVKPDKANASALAILPKAVIDPVPRLWALVQETCPLPLLDHWRDTVLDLLRTQRMLSSLPFLLGALDGYRLTLDVPALTTALGDLIRSGRLGIAPHDQPLPAPLRRVA